MDCFELDPFTKIKAKLLNLFKYLSEFCKIFLLKLKKLLKTFVEITLTLIDFIFENFPFVIA